MSTRKRSFVTVTDQFCGAGGSSLGATAAGVEIDMALNHWQLAVDSHQSNFPNTRHDCTDISACDPRRYPSSDILITSPECTNHSLAKGKRRPHYKEDLFGNVLIDPSEERSRATMWDVCRFAEYHQYAMIIVENVVDARQWLLWDDWLRAMHTLGYQHQCVYFNSMFAWPTPQSRDRMYVVFHRHGSKAPDLNIRPVAWCERCSHQVEAQQTWKSAQKQYGRYGARGQYIYACPECRQTVHPWYAPALTAIDWSLPVQRIGDRARPLKEATLRRIRLGLERFAGQQLVVELAYGHARNNRSTPIVAPWPTQTGQQTLGFLAMLRTNSRPRGLDDALQTVVTDNQHFLIRMTGAAGDANSVLGLADALDTQVAAGSQHALIVQLRNHQTTQAIEEALSTVTAGGRHHGLLVPFLTRHYGQAGGDETFLSTPVGEPLRTVTSQDHHSLTVPPFLTSYYGGSDGVRTLDEAAGTLTGHDRHALVQPMPFVNSYYGDGTYATIDQAMGTQIGTEHQGLVQPQPFVVSQYGGEHRNPVHATTEPLMTVPGMEIHRLAVPGEIPSVDDCGFRMLEPHEIQAAMAFPKTYTVLGNKRQRVKQLGNAVTPPVMQILIERCVATLGGA